MERIKNSVAWGLVGTLALLMLVLNGGLPRAAHAAPANDDFANAVNLTPTVTTAEIAATNTVGAGTEPNESPPCGQGGATVWYNWTSL
jgi:hypothetical protein